MVVLELLSEKIRPEKVFLRHNPSKLYKCSLLWIRGTVGLSQESLGV